MKQILQITNEDGSVRVWPAFQFVKANVSTGETSRVDFVGYSENLPTLNVCDFLEIPVPTLPPEPEPEAVAGEISPIGEPIDTPHVEPARSARR